MSTTTLLSVLHFLGATILCTTAVIHLLVHPLSVASTTITVVLLSLGGLLIVQELPTPRSEGSRAWLLSSYAGRAVCFLLATAVTFDRLDDLPCDTPTSGSSPYSTTTAKFSVSAGDAASKVTDSTQNSFRLPKEHPPPVFGTAFYVCRSLAPQCTRIDGVPDQPAGSVAWIHVAANLTAQPLVLAFCAITLAISIVYFLLALLHRSGRIGLSPSMTRTLPTHDGVSDDPHSLRNVEVHRFEQTCKEASVYRVNACRCAPAVDLYAEQALSQEPPPASRCTSAEISLRASTTGRRCSVEGAATTPEAFRCMDSPSLSTRAASDVGLPSRRGEARYGYEYGYGRTDFASGCIMHYPLFKKRKEKVSQVEVFPTLSPPDFSRASLTSQTGLTPRKGGKRQLSVGSRLTLEQGEREQEVDAGARAVTENCAVQLDNSGMQHDTALPIDNPTNAMLSTHTRKRSKPHKPRQTLHPAHHSSPQRRLGTAESNRSILSTLTTSRPGTATSIKSAAISLRTRRRRGLLATLDLHFGHRLSGFSHDVSASGRETRCSYDSQRSCSAGTFGDGVSPVSTPRRLESSPVPPGSPLGGTAAKKDG